MSEPIDISWPLRPGMPAWPNSVGYQRRLVAAIADGAQANVSTIQMDVHCGTHVEGPLHFIEDGASVDAFGLGPFIGPSRVVYIPDADEIGPSHLEECIGADHVDRLLIRTRNSDRVAGGGEFATDFAALGLEGATWLANRGVLLVGIDYLSIQLFGGDPETHRVLMRAGVAILEGLKLHDVAPGDYRLTCLPLALQDAEAAPARAVLEPME
ncbi:MAG TPA: cyclase family protein [Thermomicrobiales bacterium]|nr:cyclase family protein [Thermomicrobiales bacterium]